MTRRKRSAGREETDRSSSCVAGFGLPSVETDPPSNA
jgi:hypothetical protein